MTRLLEQLATRGWPVVDEASRSKALWRARMLRDRIDETIALLDADQANELAIERVNEAWTVYHGVRDDEHAARMLWLSALDASRVFDVLNAMATREECEPLTAEHQKLLSRRTHALQFANFIVEQKGRELGGSVRPKAIDVTLPMRIDVARYWVANGLPEYRDRLTDNQVARALDEWNRLGGPRPGRPDKWDALAEILKEARLFKGAGSSLETEWKQWPKD